MLAWAKCTQERIVDDSFDLARRRDGPTQAKAPNSETMVLIRVRNREGRKERQGSHCLVQDQGTLSMTRRMALALVGLACP